MHINDLHSYTQCLHNTPSIEKLQCKHITNGMLSCILFDHHISTIWPAANKLTARYYSVILINIMQYLKNYHTQP